MTAIELLVEERRQWVRDHGAGPEPGPATGS
jgi:hypothetical protein